MSTHWNSVWASGWHKKQTLTWSHFWWEQSIRRKSGALKYTVAWQEKKLEYVQNSMFFFLLNSTWIKLKVLESALLYAAYHYPDVTQLPC